MQTSFILKRKLWRTTTLAGVVIWGLTWCAGLKAAEVPSVLGGGNFHSKNDSAKFQVLQQLGAGMCRIPVDARIYWNEGSPQPEKLDSVVLAAHGSGVKPILLFEYYTRWQGELGGSNKWYRIGQAFAGRFAPGSAWLKSQGISNWGIQFYSAINEPMWKDNNPTPIPVEHYREALEGLADGVHSVAATLRVSPGGYQEVPLFQNRNPYIKAVAPLYNEGKLWAIDIHRYWDVEYVPMQKGYRWSLQSQFEEVKRNAGITNDVRFYTTEMNYKKRKVTEDEAAQGFLTALWDALTVTGSQGQVVSEFVMPWNIFHTEAQDEPYGLCTRLEPWNPNARGKVLQQVCELTRGMRVLTTDPKKTGVTVLEGRAGRLWIWQNRPHWTDLDKLELKGLPAEAREVEMYGWNGLRRKLRIQTPGTLIVEGTGTPETLMLFLRVTP